MLGIHDYAQTGDTIDSAELPVRGIGYQTLADQVLRTDYREVAESVCHVAQMFGKSIAGVRLPDVGQQSFAALPLLFCFAKNELLEETRP
ncbi:MAG: hypothetical protein KDA80_13875 [Planctomycetaceae bacterium]|nr:hypothetical protein [Planctomycetaceae bacterium]